MKSLVDVEFNLHLTLSCGQVFHWDSTPEGFEGVIGELPCRLKVRGGRVYVNAEAAKAAERYFALDHPLKEIYESFPQDPPMLRALESCRGLRIIRQPIWECLATFITSAMKQVAHIRAMSQTIRRRFGKEIAWERPMFSYPGPEVIAELEERDLRECALGFRAGSLLKTARMVTAGKVDLEQLRNFTTEEARAELCKLAGVGEKIANCVLLFAYERLDAVPVDVWIARVLRELYFNGNEDVSLARLAEFSNEHFGRYAGYAQQYLFHHARVTFRRSTKLTSKSWVCEC